MMMLLCWLRTKINIKNDDNEQHIERSESWMGKTNEMKPSKKNGGKGRVKSQLKLLLCVVPESRPVDVLMKLSALLCVHSSIQHVRKKTKTLCSFLHDKHTGEESHRPRLNWKCNVIPFPSMLCVLS